MTEPKTLDALAEAKKWLHLTGTWEDPGRNPAASYHVQVAQTLALIAIAERLEEIAYAIHAIGQD